jgi:hypothetical protein
MIILQLYIIVVMEEENLTALRTINNNTYIQVEHEID